LAAIYNFIRGLAPWAGFRLPKANPTIGGNWYQQYWGQCRLKTASFDFSAIRHFWRVFESLQADSEPTYGQWDALFETPG